MADVPPEAGPERLTALLRRAGVLEHGVRGYRLDALWLDYRHSVLWQITTPM
jgi:hypothetical protein